LTKKGTKNGTRDTGTRLPDTWTTQSHEIGGRDPGTKKTKGLGTTNFPELLSGVGFKMKERRRTSGEKSHPEEAHLDDTKNPGADFRIPHRPPSASGADLTIQEIVCPIFPETMEKT
jgi:hypothetical protein